MNAYAKCWVTSVAVGLGVQHIWGKTKRRDESGDEMGYGHSPGRAIAVALVCMLVVVSPSIAQTLRVVDMHLATVSTAGDQMYGHAGGTMISGNGKYVVFPCDDDNLVDGDSNGFRDALRHDISTGETILVSLSSAGVQGNDASVWVYPFISYDGKLVAFDSKATNLVAQPENLPGFFNVHLRDMDDETTEFIAFTPELGLPVNCQSWKPSISDDGNLVAFGCSGFNLVPGDTNGEEDIFVRDLSAGVTSRVSVSTTGAQANGHSSEPRISGDGRHVAFYSGATNLVTGDTNDFLDVFVHDRQTSQTTRVSVSSAGGEGNGLSQRPSISADGRYVAFNSQATNLAPEPDGNGALDCFVHDRQTGHTELVSVSLAGAAGIGNQGNGYSWQPHINPDGRYVAFTSGASDLVDGDTNGCEDVFVRDRLLGRTIRVSVTPAGVQSNAGSSFPSISDDGRRIAFQSSASNLVPGDINGYGDVLVAILAYGTPPVLSWTGKRGFQTDGVHPNAGEADLTSFQFRVKLTDADGDGPDYVDLVLQKGGERRRLAMTGANGGTRKGRGYSVRTTLPQGMWKYRFEASDQDGPATGPPIELHDGPTIWPPKEGRPDIHVSDGATWIGNNIYNQTGEGQSMARDVQPGRGVSYRVRIQNDRNETDKVLIKGPASDDPWTVEYVRYNGKDVTDKVTGDGWYYDLPPGRVLRLKVQVHAEVSATPGTTLTMKVRAGRAVWSDAEFDANADVTELVTTVVAGASGTVQVVGLAAAPTGMGAQVTFTLSAGASVSARVLNIAGRPIKTICTARDCEAGANTLLWNAQADNGLAAPNGQYLVELTARTADGALARGLTQVRVER